MSPLKFEIDEIWKNRSGEMMLITEINPGVNYPIKAISVSMLSSTPRTSAEIVMEYTSSGHEISFDISTEFDLVTLLGTLSDFPEFLL